ncbi:MAG: hypothetical protein OXC91_14070 [Rhodobacteraceae bacterium]|nr:hypothetical protein [Paracoccaceae bacterium]
MLSLNLYDRVFMTQAVVAHIANREIRSVEQAVRRGRLQSSQALNSKSQIVGVVRLSWAADYYGWSQSVIDDLVDLHQIDVAKLIKEDRATLLQMNDEGRFELDPIHVRKHKEAGQ